MFKTKNKKNKFVFGVFRFFFGVFILICFMFLVFLVSFRFYVSCFKDDILDLKMESCRFSQVSSIYVMNASGVMKEYQKIFGNENRVWVDFSQIPKHMLDAIISIEDKRFYSHNGIDLIRSTGAVLNTILHKPSYGGSTLTQQLVKNITQDSEFTSSRKIREMISSIKLEEKYSKDEIIEFYLNIVNFGAGSYGVQAAAQVYFGKNIQDCSIAECAAIASVTQNPTHYNPLTKPENNKKRRNLVINEMYKQNRISYYDFKQTLLDSENLKFKGNVKKNKKSIQTVENQYNWYIEITRKEVLCDLIKKYGIKKNMAENLFFTSGLKIYCAMDEEAQNECERAILNKKIMPKDKNLELGFMMMNYDGRILAMLGSSKPKTNNFIFDRCNLAKRQPGSIIKPISVYTPAIEENICHYSSFILDEPLKIKSEKDGTFKNWPENWYKEYKGQVSLQWAIEKSANAPAAQLLNKLSTQKSFLFLTQKLNILNLDSNDSNSIAALATGGTHIGVTVKDMTCAFQIFGNNGKFAKPYTYLYVTDSNDRVILDNRKKPPVQIISPETASIMNRLLRQVIIGSEGTGQGANIEWVDVIGKTGTTNNDYDSWFVGLTPNVLATVWMGYDTPKSIIDTKAPVRFWKSVISNYLSNKPKKKYEYSENITAKEYCQETGDLANEFCPKKRVGYYKSNFLPRSCNLHIKK